MTAKNNPLPTIDSICMICLSPYAHTHEVYSGINRQTSIKHGFQVNLCRYHHQEWEQSPHINPKGEFNVKLKQDTQKNYEETHSRDEFLILIGRSYL